jgi:hypothetical protein
MRQWRQLNLVTGNVVVLVNTIGTEAADERPEDLVHRTSRPFGVC